MILFLHVIHVLIRIILTLGFFLSLLCFGTFLFHLRVLISYSSQVPGGKLFVCVPHCNKYVPQAHEPYLNFYKRRGAYSFNDKLSYAISLVDCIISFGKVEKYYSNISTIITVYHACTYINVVLPREAGSKKQQFINNFEFKLISFETFQTLFAEMPIDQSSRLHCRIIMLQNLKQIKLN